MLYCDIGNWIVRYCVAKDMFLNMNVLRRSIAKTVDMINHSSVCVWIIECHVCKIVEILKLHFKTQTIIIFIGGWIAFHLSRYITFSITDILSHKFPSSFFLFVGFNRESDWPYSI